MGTRGTWWELFANLVRTKGFWWDIDGNKRNLMGTWWEIKSPSLQKDKKHPLGACLHHPIGSPLQKLRNIPRGMLVPNNASKWVGSREQEKIFENIPCHVMKSFLYICFPCGKFQVTWQNIPWHASYIMPHHQNIFWNQPRFIDFKHGLARHSSQVEPYVRAWRQKKIKICIS